MPATWNPKVEVREHPFGRAGVNSSLDEVAKKIAAGYLDPRVRVWSIETLDRARDDGKPVKKPIDRARILLAACQKKLWVPDPVGAEYMMGAHLLACDKDKPKPGEVCVRGGDCDDLKVLLGSSWMSVGIHTLVVGHGYDDEGNVEHVLAAAHLDGRWHYGDPSTDLPLGKCIPFTHERCLSIPNIKVVCDKRVCIGSGGGRHIDPDELEFVEKGVFVGVDGPPALAGLAAPIVWIAGSDALDRAVSLAHCRC